jgi:hypothetical protein
MQPLAHCKYSSAIPTSKKTAGRVGLSCDFDLQSHISLQSFSQHDWQKELLAKSGHASHHSEFSHLPDFKPAHFTGKKLGD